ncbi:MAG: hypothetical protein WC496_03820 [Phycisphaerae bacterium]|jgi:hypothetical protein
MINSAKKKICEDKFIGRLRENLAMVENHGPIQEGDNLSELRKLTEGKMLRSELESKFPSGKFISIRITTRAGLFGKRQRPIELTGKVIIRLDRLVKSGNDDEPISLGELSAILSKESDLATRGCFDCILGLFSPTGWNDEAKRFVINEPSGSGWASNAVYPILAGPEIPELVWDRKSTRLSEYIQYFCGLTLDERGRVCRDAIKRAVMVREFANLEKIAIENSFSLEFVKDIAGQFAAESEDMVLSKVSGVGFVLKKKI